MSEKLKRRWAEGLKVDEKPGVIEFVDGEGVVRWRGDLSELPTETVATLARYGLSEVLSKAQTRAESVEEARDLLAQRWEKLVKGEWRKQSEGRAAVDVEALVDSVIVVLRESGHEVPADRRDAYLARYGADGALRRKALSQPEVAAEYARRTGRSRGPALEELAA